MASNIPFMKNDNLSFNDDPIRSIIYSLILINKRNEISGLDQWVHNTAKSMSSFQLWENTYLIEGFFHAIQPAKSFTKFEEYLKDLENTDPQTMLNRMYSVYKQLDYQNDDLKPDWNTALSSEDQYIKYISSKSNLDQKNIPIEIEAYRLQQNPEKMKNALINHLRYMWDNFVKSDFEKRANDWAKISSILRDGNFLLNDPNDLKNILCCSSSEHQRLTEILESKKNVYLIPSLHVGPYIGKIMSPDAAYLLFSLSSIQTMTPTNELTMARFQALGDQTRLEILFKIAQETELTSPDIMNEFSLSQSATSRALKQLSATSLLSEKRMEGTKNTKSYSINTGTIKQLVAALKMLATK